MKWLTNLKNKISEILPNRQSTYRFYKENKNIFEIMVDNWDTIQAMIVYKSVFRDLILAVSDGEIDLLNEEKPCKYRGESDVPFRVDCKAEVQGESQKKLKQCENCTFRQG